MKLIQTTCKFNDGRYVLSGSDETARLSDVTKDPVKYVELEGLKGDIESVEFTPDDRFLLIRSRYKAEKIWILNPLFKIIDKLNVPELVWVDKILELMLNDQSYDNLLSNPEYLKILETSAYKSELKHYLFDSIVESYTRYHIEAMMKSKSFRLI